MTIILDGTNGAGVPVVTTTEKNSLTVNAGYLVFDSTLGKLCVYNGTVWQTVTST
jgi:hypothetical protein